MDRQVCIELGVPMLFVLEVGQQHQGIPAQTSGIEIPWCCRPFYRYKRDNDTKFDTNLTVHAVGM